MTASEKTADGPGVRKHVHDQDEMLRTLRTREGIDVRDIDDRIGDGARPGDVVGHVCTSARLPRPARANGSPRKRRRDQECQSQCGDEVIWFSQVVEHAPIASPDAVAGMCPGRRREQPGDQEAERLYCRNSGRRFRISASLLSCHVRLLSLRMFSAT